MQLELQNYPNKKLIRSFGRIKSRKLSDHKNSLLNNLLPNFEIKNYGKNLDQISSKSDLSQSKNIPYVPLTYGRGSPQAWGAARAALPYPKGIKAKNILEIGFGFGDFIFEKAKQNPTKFFFGCEPHLNGVVNLLAKLEKVPLKNLRISNVDVRILLGNFPDKFFDEVFILFPDPWPKIKHFKRRLISLEFLDEILAPKMKNGATLTLATDHDSYKTWILAQIISSKNFTWNANCKKDWQIFPDDWVITKYQKKAEIEGRQSVIFNLTCQN
ncbi:MAG: tRNA (guanine(46)-N(7))-methyltransferase TrmB [Rickettsiales bacterium]|nr:tRNA (guanine(46)-N(7))-methyltransferase TrmB [Rickettsiales bacterium]